MANLTVVQDETHTLNAKWYPSIPSNVAAFVIVLNILFSITASLGNALILIALHKVSSIFPPTKLLFRSLAVTDLCAGLISQPLFALDTIIRLEYTNSNLSYYTQQLGTGSGFILCTVSILTSTAISVDRLLALLLGLRYRQVVTLRRARVIVSCVWVLSCALGGSRYTTWGSTVTKTVFPVVLLLSVVSSVFSYINIYLHLRHRRIQVGARHDQQAQTSNEEARALNIARYKKTTSSIAWLQFTMLVCYLPFIVVGLLFAKRTKFAAGVNEMVFSRIAISILYLNSSLNPFLYCWKIREVRKVVKDTMTQIQCCCESN